MSELTHTTPMPNQLPKLDSFPTLEQIPMTDQYQLLNGCLGENRLNPEKCQICETTKAKTFEWANLTGNYSDLTDYKRMCGSCHSKYDNKVENFKGGDAL